MAKEYIEREAVTRILTEAADAYGTFTTERSIYLTAREKVQNIPAADVAEVVHGRWIDNGSNGYKWAFICSKCGYIDGYPFDDRYNFCPDCGAKMDGGE